METKEEAPPRDDKITYKVKTRLEKYASQEDFDAGKIQEIVEDEGNMVVYGGYSVLWHRLTGGTSVTAFDNSNAHIGVGDSSTAAALTQTDLQASTNKLRKAMDATYPSHTDGTGSGGASVVFRSTFGASDANFAWQEWALFNASSTGRMLNRKVTSLGTKANPAVWVFSVTLSN